jgi:hypothetical protein
MNLFCVGAISLVAALLSGCSSPPAIAAGIRCDRAEVPGDCAEADRAFNRAVRKHFPIGSDEDRLKQELIAEGFTQGPGPLGLPSNSLIDSACGRLSLICLKLLSVEWTSDSQGRITSIQGHYSVGSF